MYAQSPSRSCTSASLIYPLPYLSSTTPQNRHRYRAPDLAVPSSKTLQKTFFFPRSFNNSFSLKLSRSHSIIRCLHELSASANSPESPKNCVIPAGQSRVDALEAGRVWNCRRGARDGVFNSLAKPVAFALFWMLLGLCPIRGWQPPALAVPAIMQLTGTKKDEKGAGRKVEENNHEYSGHTRRLLDKVSIVLKAIEDVRSSKGTVKDVKEALKEVNLTKKELQEDIMVELHGLMREMGLETEKLVERSEDVQNSLSSVEAEHESLLFKLRMARGGDKGVRKKVKGLEREIDIGVKEYNAIQETLEEMEDQFLRKEAIALDVGVRELSFIEKECELLVKKFIEETESELKESVPKKSAVGLSRLAIQNDLEAAQREHLKQLILHTLLEGEGSEPLLDQDSVNFVQRIVHALEDSKNYQKELKAKIRKDMKKFGDEKWLLVNTPLEEVVKGFPEVELKWMFGDKEVMIPKGISIHLFHGWRKWREERKADFKRELLENVDCGKQYVKQRQERIILDRDRVVAKTVFNEEKSQWEIDPMAVPYAVSKKLVEYARIRHDWGAMYIAIKGDDKEYYIDIKEYEMLFEDFGGFDGLYLKMLASGTPTSVQLMPIPFSELNLYQQLVLTARLSYPILNSLWKMALVSSAKDWIVETVKYTNDDILMMIVFPLVELIIPYPIRIMCGMAWPEEIDQAVGTPWYLKWQSETEMRFRLRKGENIRWYFWFIIRTVVYGYVLFHVFQFVRRKIPRLLRILGFGPLLKNPNVRKLQKLRASYKFFLWTYIRSKNGGFDPIKTAFENMKRVRNPPIPLKDFASVESMKEEINEVIAFLRNPYAFQKLGARAPRGVLIVGEMGTGKTSLALAIAAEAKVPVVKVEPEQLEAGLWVGQSAANIRELFQTARDLAPVIIFVEDFDRFAGVRGKFIHTKKQDHEAFINQLLVELDGFEKQDGVVLMATTRNVKQIDPALKRPGRMDRIFYLQHPTQVEREKILRIAAKDTMDPEIIDFIDWSKVAEKTTNLSPIDLKRVPVALEGSAFRNKFLDTDELLSYCSWFATFSSVVPNWLRRTQAVRKFSSVLVNHLGLALTKEDLQSVVDLMEPYGQISNGIELLSPTLDWTRETKLLHAVWAAGRGLMALLLPNFDIVDNIWLEPFSWEGIGCTKITRAEGEGSVHGNVETISYLEKKLVFCFGSHIASQMLLPFGEENFLSSSELKQAQEIATRMVIQYGWGPDDSPVIYYHGNAVTALSMGNRHEFEVAAKVEKMYDLAYDRAKKMLQKNRRVLEKIVDDLLEHEILTGKDLARIMEENGGVREHEPFSLSRVYESEPLSVDYLNVESSSGTALLGTA